MTLLPGRYSFLKTNNVGFFLIFLLLIFTGCKTSEHVEEGGYPFWSQDHSITTPAASGLWLMPQLQDSVLSYLQHEGITLSAEEIYSTQKPSLSQAVVRIQVGDNTVGTGSFVSDKGLILTDQQSAISAIASASTLENNLLEDGFYASSMSKEIPAENYSIHIPIEQVDVTQQIEAQIPDDASYGQKLRYQQQIRNQLRQERKGGNDDLLVEIKDVWGGNKHYMFVYEVINDIRLVHTWPSDIRQKTQFGIYSSYNISYTFLRAYGPDSKPYHPDKHLEIAKGKPYSGDPVFTLNFPASTYKYENSFALEHYHNVLNPVLIQSQQSVLDALQHTAKQDSQKAIETAAQRYTLTSNQNYYRNIQHSFDEQNVIEKKKELEEKLKQWIKNDAERSLTYRKLLEQLEQSYSIASQSADLLYATLYPLNNNLLVQIAGMYAPYFKHLQNPDSLSFSDFKKQQLLQNHKSILNNTDRTGQTEMLKEMVKTIATLPEGKIPFFLLDYFDPYETDVLDKNIDSFVDSLKSNSIVFDPDKAEAFLAMSTKKAQAKPTDPFVSFYNGLLETFTFARQNYQKHFPYAVPAQRRYVKALKEFRGEPLAFPDANRTLRLSYGKMISPSVELLEEGNKLQSFSTLNNATNGSLGGPVLNAKGKLIGVSYNIKNTDLIGDYLLDSTAQNLQNGTIHYIFFLMEQYKADRLIQEITKN